MQAKAVVLPGACWAQAQRACLVAHAAAGRVVAQRSVHRWALPSTSRSLQLLRQGLPAATHQLLTASTGLHLHQRPLLDQQHQPLLRQASGKAWRTPSAL